MNPPVSLERTTNVAAQPSDMERRLHGRVALITGASDKGIGGAIAERFIREGAHVALISRHEPAQLMKKLAKLDSAHATFVAGDVTQPNDIRTVIDSCLHDYGRLDFVINNAGIEIAKRFESMTAEEVRMILDVNLQGAIEVTRQALPHLKSGGVVVNLASTLALAGCQGFSIYSASKAGLIGFTQSLAWEVAARGIRVVAVAPGLVVTPMTRKHIEHLKEEELRQIMENHPLGVGRPRDVSGAVAFLCSDDARWITGITLPLGWTQHYPIPGAMRG
jgi:NAD(P)-dependent dehydrogenase (short-subunit alcohol dehydrogenase family)